MENAGLSSAIAKVIAGSRGIRGAVDGKIPKEITEDSKIGISNWNSEGFSS